MTKMLKAKRIKLVDFGALLGVIGFRCELEDGTFWSFSGKGLQIGFLGGGGGDGDKGGWPANLSVRSPSEPGGLEGDCAFSSAAGAIGVGGVAIAMWDTHGTVGTLTALNAGAGLGIIPMGWGTWKRETEYE